MLYMCLWIVNLFFVNFIIYMNIINHRQFLMIVREWGPGLLMADVWRTTRIRSCRLYGVQAEWVVRSEHIPGAHKLSVVFMQKLPVQIWVSIQLFNNLMCLDKIALIRINFFDLIAFLILSRHIKNANCRILIALCNPGMVTGAINLMTTWWILTILSEVRQELFELIKHRESKQLKFN